MGYVTDALGLPTKLETCAPGSASSKVTTRRGSVQGVQHSGRESDGSTRGTAFLVLPHAGLWTGQRRSCPACGGTDLTPGRHKSASYRGFCAPVERG